MRHKDFDVMLETALKSVRTQTKEQTREYFCNKFNDAITTNDADALVFWSSVFVIWKGAPLSDQTRYLSLSMAVQAPYLPKSSDQI